MRAISGSSNQGWYVLDSPRFLDFIKSIPRIRVGDKYYLSFEIEYDVRGNLQACSGHPTFGITFEDGGNHGSTGNLPTLEISY